MAHHPDAALKSWMIFFDTARDAGLQYFDLMAISLQARMMNATAVGTRVYTSTRTATAGGRRIGNSS